MNKVYLSLGSNIGDRLEQLNEAKKELTFDSEIKILKSSSIYETEPWPKTDQPDDHPHQEKGQKWHLNQVILAETQLDPVELLSLIQKIEHKMGKVERKGWGAREIDIDILLYEEEIIDLPNLQIPHRHMNDRQFILAPLLEIASNLKDPVSKRPYSDILYEVKQKDDHKVIHFL